MLVDNSPPEGGDLSPVLIFDDLEARLDRDGVLQQLDENSPVCLFYLVVVAVLQGGTFEHLVKSILNTAGVDKQSVVEGANLFKGHVGVAQTALVHLILLQSPQGLLKAVSLIAF